MHSTEVCQQYEGNEFCHSVEGYGDGNWTVYVNRSQSKWGPLGLDAVEQFLESLLSQLTVNGDDTLSPGCEHAIRQLLCRATLPFCKKQGEQERDEVGNSRERERERERERGDC